MRTIRQIFGMRKTEGLVGVEIEVEGGGLPLSDHVPMWKVERDGSLRGEGYEYITKGAVSLETLSENLNALVAAIEKQKSKVNDAYRGSVHVHVNVQEKTLEQIFTTLFVWLMVEPIWMRLMGPTRDGNLFCMTSSGGGDIVQFCKRMLSVQRNEMYYNFPHRGKYASLNTDCLNGFGSLEFRTFPSSVDPRKIRQWAEWSANLVELGASVKPSEMGKLWGDALNEPTKFLSKIFDKETTAVLDPLVVFNLLEQGIEAASDLILVWDEHDHIMKDPKSNGPPVIAPIMYINDWEPHPDEMDEDEEDGDDWNDMPIDEQEEE